MAARTGSRWKYSSILLAIVASGLALTASTQTWYSLHLTTAAGHAGDIAVTGSNAAPAVAALSLAGVAFACALALAGPILRYVLAALGLVLAASIIGSAAGAMADPIGSGISVVTTDTGIAGDASVRAIIESAQASAWPALALAGGILLAVSALVVIVTSHRWPGTSRRYGATQPVLDRHDDADSAAHVSGGTSGASGPTNAADERARARDAAIDDWDELSRGDDPTERATDADDAPDDAEDEADDGTADDTEDGPSIR